jgi:glucose-6-phosphate isomerase
MAMLPTATASTNDRESGLSEAAIFVSLRDGSLTGHETAVTRRTIGDLAGIFLDEVARAALPQDEIAYRVEAYHPVPESTPGGLFWGVTHIEPGLVGDEFHAVPDRSEFYWGFSGAGILLLMDRNRRCWGERIVPGSLHYVPAHVAHRVANIGDATLSVGACWHSDAGHDYEEIARRGFSARLRRVGGQPRLVQA